MNKLASLVILSLIAIQSYAQSLSGTVKDIRNEVLPGATVRLLNQPDSSLVAGTITDEKGQFQFNQLSNTVYVLSISSLGQKKFISAPLTVSDAQNTISLPIIILSPDQNIELAEVVVKARKPLIEQELDKTIVNVASMISSATSNSLEVLEKTPGVSINPNGDISLNGKSGVLVLIDGRSTYLSGADLAAYLKSLPGGLLEKIELIDNPSARYDAAGNAIINIKLRKNRSGGFTGSYSIGLSQGRYSRNNDALNLNYSYKKINVFANLGYSYDKNYTQDTFDRRFYDSNSALQSTVNLTNLQTARTNSYNANLGLDFAATSKTTFGIIFNLNQSDRKTNFDYVSNNFDPAHALQLTGLGGTFGKENRTNTGLNLNLLHKFNDFGRELSVDANYLHYHSHGNQQLQNRAYFPGNELVNLSNFTYLTPSDINIYTIKSDYVHPFKNKARIETGFKSSLISNGSIFEYYSVNEGIPVKDYSNSNNFKYRENITAFYINGQKSWERWGAQLGLRVETTAIKGNQLGNEIVAGSKFEKNYANLFPSAFFSYKLDKDGKNSLGLLAVRRISRPNYQLLNPFVFQRDQYTYSSGNPDLDPQFQNRLELKYQHKQLLSMGLSYNKFTSSIFQMTETIDSILFNRPDNIKGGYMVLLNTSLNTQLTKWWFTNSTLRLSRMGLRGIIYGEVLHFDTNIVRFELNNSFTLSKTISAEFGGYYASRDFNGQAVTKGMYILNLSVQKKIWDGKGSIRLSVGDIFHSWVYHNRSISLVRAKYFQTNTTDTQRIGMAFTYRFGKETFNRKRKHSNNASDEEKERL